MSNYSDPHDEDPPEFNLGMEKYRHATLRNQSAQFKASETIAVADFDAGLDAAYADGLAAGRAAALAECTAICERRAAAHDLWIPRRDQAARLEALAIADEIGRLETETSK